ncbi:LamB/YcsF family protein [Sciscionella sediminilitoris]|uniref:LamB/YcsF family protein n=1 Tax=Sciscionella sediminilitoris TaxID=1445613 RepID=UPI0004DF609A|nr:5-oxoprolinase subunit PxpA [Sciscionella sp. SE31]
MKHLIDLNADAGESFGRWRLGDDAAVIPQVTSVNVACGWHAGDPATMRRSIELARDHGVALGAHPGLPDLAGFGRRAMTLAPGEAADACLYQYGALRGIADSLGTPVTHIKPHGAFYGLTIREPGVTDAISDAVQALPGDVLLVLLAGPTADRALARNPRIAREAFADLDYDDEGHIIIEPDPQPKDPQACARQMLDILRGEVTSVRGKTIPVDADTVCIHGDRPNAPEIARVIREQLAEHQVEIAPIHEVLAARG